MQAPPQFGGLPMYPSAYPTYFPQQSDSGGGVGKGLLITLLILVILGLMGLGIWALIVYIKKNGEVLQLSGPSTATVNQAVNLNVSAEKVLNNTTVTFADSLGGHFNPASVVLTAASPSAVVVYTPASPGSASVSITNDQSLPNPDPLAIVIVPPPPATALTFSGPATGTVNTAAMFTIGVNGVLGSGMALQVIPSDNNGGGRFVPPAVSLTAGAPSTNVTYIPNNTVGQRVLSATSSGSLNLIAPPLNLNILPKISG